MTARLWTEGVLGLSGSGRPPPGLRGVPGRAMRWGGTSPEAHRAGLERDRPGRGPDPSGAVSLAPLAALRNLLRDGSRTTPCPDVVGHSCATRLISDQQRTLNPLSRRNRPPTGPRGPVLSRARKLGSLAPPSWFSRHRVLEVGADVGPKPWATPSTGRGIDAGRRSDGERWRGEPAHADFTFAMPRGVKPWRRCLVRRRSWPVLTSQGHAIGDRPPAECIRLGDRSVAVGQVGHPATSRIGSFGKVA